MAFDGITIAGIVSELKTLLVAYYEGRDDNSIKVFLKEKEDDLIKMNNLCFSDYFLKMKEYAKENNEIIY